MKDPKRKVSGKKLRVGLIATATGAALIAAPLAIAAETDADTQARPDFQMPFTCDETWEGNTRPDHEPPEAIDFRGPEIQGVDAIASAPGTVAHIEDRGNESYGKVVFIEHDDDWFTTYAHLEDWSVEVGDSVDFGSQIGTVGSTGSSTGPHLHFEQRTGDYLGDPQEIVMDGEAAEPGNKDYTSNNGC